MIGPGIFNASGMANPIWVIPGILNMNNNRIINISTPTASSDVATKGYVDAAVGAGGGTYTCDEACKDYSLMTGNLYIYADAGSPVKRVFVTSQSWNGNLGGFNGADAKCQTAANNAGLGGTWKAWLSDSTTNAKDRISDGFYVRARDKRVWNNCWCGRVIASNKAQLTDGGIDVSISNTEYGAVPGYYPVFTATNAQGNSAGSACSSWTSNIGCVSPGRNDVTNEEWTMWAASGCCSPGTGCRCSESKHLYCFEQ